MHSKNSKTALQVVSQTQPPPHLGGNLFVPPDGPCPYLSMRVLSIVLA